MKIQRVRAVLLSAPYADARTSAEVILHLPSGLRTTGLVEIALDDGRTGLGEGYLAVFAPQVFVAIVDLLAPVLVGRDVEDVERLLREVRTTTGYWSFQGAAQHVVSAVEIALQDLRAQLRGVPVWKLLGGAANRPLRLYASGGDSVGPEPMQREIEAIAAHGIGTFKIRARSHQAEKVAWCQRRGAGHGIQIAVDMTQNLAIPSQTLDDITRFLREVQRAGGSAPVFLEEPFGPLEIGQFVELRCKKWLRVAGGEIVTTAADLAQRLRQGCYDIVQPDATVVGGIGAVLEVFSAAKECGAEVYVHCWGGPVGMMANYHAALAGGGELVEWPLPSYPLREAMAAEPWRIDGGHLRLPEVPGLGVRLTPEIEREYAFRSEAVYRCLVDPGRLPTADWTV